MILVARLIGLKYLCGEKQAKNSFASPDEVFFMYRYLVPSHDAHIQIGEELCYHPVTS